jgi:hypothetical protein
METPDSIRRKMEKSYQKHAQSGGWRAVGEEFHVSGGVAWKIVVKKIYPKKPAILARLGLPALAIAPACAKCGKVPLRKHCDCTNKPRQRRQFYNPKDVLKRCW